MNFETRLDALKRSSNVTNFEIDAAVNIYERTLTAYAISQSVFGAGTYSPEIVATLVEQLTSESRFLMLNDERLLSEGALDNPS